MRLLIGTLLFTTPLGCQLLVPDWEFQTNDTNGGTSPQEDDEDGTESEPDTEPEPDPTTRDGCFRSGGYWYDENDVFQETPDDFTLLTPRCHEEATRNCDGLAEVKWAVLESNDFLTAETTVTTLIYDGWEEPLLITTLLSPLRCITELGHLSVRHNDISSAVLMNNDALYYIDIYNNNYLSNLVLTRNPDVEQLHLNHTALTQLDISYMSKLEILYASGINMRLPDLDIENKCRLQILYVGGNDLAGELDLSCADRLQILDLSDNLFTNITLPSAPLLHTVQLDNNALTAISIPALQNLAHLSLADNELDYPDAAGALLDLTGCDNLEDVNLSSNSEYELSFEAGTFPPSFLTRAGAMLYIEIEKWEAVVEDGTAPEEWVYDIEHHYCGLPAI